MSSHNLPKSYADAAARFAHRGGSFKLCHNTWLEQTGFGCSTEAAANGRGAYLVRFHSTVVVRFDADGTATLNSGGWRTHTTKARLNWCGFRVGQRAFTWSLQLADATLVPFVDGMRVFASVTGGWLPAPSLKVGR